MRQRKKQKEKGFLAFISPFFFSQMSDKKNKLKNNPGAPITQKKKKIKLNKIRNITLICVKWKNKKKNPPRDITYVTGEQNFSTLSE